MIDAIQATRGVILRASATGEGETLWLILVLVAAQRNGHLGAEFLHCSYSKGRVISGDDKLLLLNETRAQILIPWFTVRLDKVH